MLHAGQLQRFTQWSQIIGNLERSSPCRPTMSHFASGKHGRSGIFIISPQYHVSRRGNLFWNRSRHSCIIAVRARTFEALKLFHWAIRFTTKGYIMSRLFTFSGGKDSSVFPYEHSKFLLRSLEDRQRITAWTKIGLMGRLVQSHLRFRSSNVNQRCKSPLVDCTIIELNKR